MRNLHKEQTSGNEDVVSSLQAIASLRSLDFSAFVVVAVVVVVVVDSHQINGGGGPQITYSRLSCTPLLVLRVRWHLPSSWKI